jgi:hypothetical protein
LVVDGHLRADARLNPTDHAGRISVSLPWPRLRLPALEPSAARRKSLV